MALAVKYGIREILGSGVNYVTVVISLEVSVQNDICVKGDLW